MTMTPRRIQRKRTKSWYSPDNMVYVERPTIFGNPFSAKDGVAKGSGLKN
jgi:hypothetical protein